MEQDNFHTFVSDLIFYLLSKIQLVLEIPYTYRMLITLFMLRRKYDIFKIRVVNCVLLTFKILTNCKY